MIPSPIFAARLQRHHEVPRSPTNRERIQAYRAIAPIELGNSYFTERLRAREYERQEMADGRERYATGDHNA